MAKPGKPIKVAASELKNAWHEYLERVSRARQEVVVTRYGRPVARLSPFDEPDQEGAIFGILAGSVTVHGDIVAPVGDSWDADARDPDA